MNQNGDILYESSETTQSKENPRPLSDTLKSIVRKMTDYARSRDWGIYGIGIGAPSVVDNGMVLFANNLSELDNQQLDLALAEFNLPVFIDNDANLRRGEPYQHLRSAKGDYRRRHWCLIIESIYHE